MWLIGAVVLLTVLLIWSFVARARKSAADRASANDHSIPFSAERAGDKNESSVLSLKAVQLSLASGAPPVPWLLRREDAEAMALLSSYFARAIPTPTSDGRVSVKQTLGHGGPQLELYVPVLSTKSPVAVLTRCWDPGVEDLAARLFFFGAVGGRLASIVKRLGFEREDEPVDKSMTVFRNRRSFARQRAG